MLSDNHQRLHQLPRGRIDVGELYGKMQWEMSTMNLHQMKLPALVIAVLTTLALLGCGGKPSLSDGRKQLEGQIQAQSNGLIRLVSFDKTNGVEQNMNGMNLYEMDYTAEIEFLGDCMWGSGGAFGGGRIFEAFPGSPGGGLDAFNPRYFLKQKARKGERRKIEGKFMFQKTEQEWRLVG
jgi:hypothetical protein